jgi:hypothetical protein
VEYLKDMKNVNPQTLKTWIEGYYTAYVAVLEILGQVTFLTDKLIINDEIVKYVEDLIEKEKPFDDVDMDGIFNIVKLLADGS